MASGTHHLWHSQAPLQAGSLSTGCMRPPRPASQPASSTHQRRCCRTCARSSRRTARRADRAPRAAWHAWAPPHSPVIVVDGDSQLVGWSGSRRPLSCSQSCASLTPLNPRLPPRPGLPAGSTCATGSTGSTCAGVAGLRRGAVGGLQATAVQYSCMPCALHYASWACLLSVHQQAQPEVTLTGRSSFPRPSWRRIAQTGKHGTSSHSSSCHSPRSTPAQARNRR